MPRHDVNHLHVVYLNDFSELSIESGTVG